MRMLQVNFGCHFGRYACEQTSERGREREDREGIGGYMNAMATCMLR